MSVENKAAFGYCSFTIGSHFENCKYAFHTGTTPCISVSHISPTIFVPERTGINQTFSGLYQSQWRPAISYFFCLCHIDAEVGIAIINIEFVVVITDTWSPYAIAMLHGFENRFRR